MEAALDLLSWYSFGWGVHPPGELVRTAAALGYETLGLLDRANLCGLGPFLEACAEHGVTPVVGARMPLADGVVYAIAADAGGYAALCGLITRLHLPEEPSPAAEDWVSAPPGVLVISDSPSLLMACREAGREAWAAWPGRTTPVCRLARRLDLPRIPLTGMHYLSRGDEAFHRLLRAMALRLGRDNVPPGETAPPKAALPSPQALRAGLGEDAPGAWRNLAALLERVTYRGPGREPVFPHWRGVGQEAGLSPEAALYRRVEAGARWRFGEMGGEVRQRLDKELSLIIRKGFGSYFLIVQDIVRGAARVCGRGSGAASLVAFCLGITNVDPVKHGLWFERFLNEAREDPPDIDVDFPWDERDAVLARVFATYGKDHTAMIATHQTLQPKAALHEVARAYGLPETEINRVTKHYGATDFWRKAQSVTPAGTVDLPDPWPEIMAGANRLLGIPRHMGLHPGGVVITPRPVREHAPVQVSKKGPLVIQWEKDFAEEAGLVKIDLLGNRSLAVVRDALAMLREAGEETPREADWHPEDDPTTQALMASGRTMGVFYVESPAMRQLQVKTGKGDFEHLVIHSSIIRPAALRWINEYVLRLRGKAYDIPHPALENLLSESYGILCYQEDVTRVAMDMAGFTQREADKLRKALGKPDAERVVGKFREPFFAGCRASGVPQAVIEETWAMVESFTGYSFCKPHSASYAMVSFQSAWLKARHPAPFMAAVLKNGGGFYGPLAYISEARRFGVKVLGPCVNHSRQDYRGAGTTLRVGLNAIKGLSRRGVETVLAERERRGPFAHLRDFLSRTELAQDDQQALTEAGALDSLKPPHATRAHLQWEALVHHHHRQAWTPKRNGRAAPLAGLDGSVSPSDLLERLPPLGLEQVRRNRWRQFQRLGFLPDTHPLTCFWGKALASLRRMGAGELPRHIGETVTLAGWPIAMKPVRTVHGQAMSFFSFEDEHETFDAVFFPDAYRRHATTLLGGAPVALRGTVEDDLGALSLHVDTLKPLPEWAKMTQFRPPVSETVS